MPGVTPALGWFPSRSFGPLPEINSAAANLWPPGRAGTSSVPYVFVPLTWNDTSVLVVAGGEAVGDDAATGPCDALHPTVAPIAITTLINTPTGFRNRRLPARIQPR
ncbi:hypothetical protein GCM10011575_10860 [Microlunatus endophyticus]|uniref:Uncharacterized protein n=1 Tax=Microlunatus endophyticus TaxID=1716077 RepID=A0A917W2A2_9ACTN|nr:hypothetical protein GCM10011575_10860 [Microlunatus endophyticus]